MPITDIRGLPTYTESDMQRDVADFFKHNRYFFADRFTNVIPEIYREISIPEIGRRSDVLIKMMGRLINIECKLGDYSGVLMQAKDYLSGVDYSYWYKNGATGLVTDGTVHNFEFNTTNKVTGGNITAQDYAIIVWCYDEDWNSGQAYAAFKINVTES